MGNEWQQPKDQLLPYVLFAYREVPCAFSPFDLLFGCHVRGPLDIVLKDSQVITAANWVLEMRVRLEQMCGFPWDNQMDHQGGMVMRYNKRAQCKSFELGDQVLALLPDGAAKLKAQWHKRPQSHIRLTCLWYVASEIIL